MAKKGMKRPSPKEFGIHVSQNTTAPVPEIHGKAKTTKQRVKRKSQSEK